jgi:hypothetical protein
VIYCTSLAFIVVVLPLGLFFYETEEQNDYRMRLWTAVKKEVLTFVLCTLLVCCSYAGLSYSSIPVDVTACDWDPEQIDEQFSVF